MKTKIFFVVLMAAVTLKAQQSVVILGTGTSLDVQPGADFCADSIGGSGILAGGGTICGQPVTFVDKLPSDLLPTRYDMGQNYPNPFNPTTVIKFQLPKTSHVVIRIYDAIGREVGKLFDADQSAGFYTVTLDGNALSTGVYFYRIEAHEISGHGAFIKTLKMVLIK